MVSSNSRGKQQLSTTIYWISHPRLKIQQAIWNRFCEFDFIQCHSCLRECWFDSWKWWTLTISTVLSIEHIKIDVDYYTRLFIKNNCLYDTYQIELALQCNFVFHQDNLYSWTFYNLTFFFNLTKKSCILFAYHTTNCWRRLKLNSKRRKELTRVLACLCRKTRNFHLALTVIWGWCLHIYCGLTLFNPPSSNFSNIQGWFYTMQVVKL